MTQFHPLDAGQWAEKHFGGLELGDRRRAKRAVTIAQGMAAHTGKSIPSLFQRTADIKAAYTFFQRPEATPGRLQGTDQQQVKAEMHSPGTLLLLEDSSEFAWSRKTKVSGLGGVGDMRSHIRQGFMLHSTLAVRWRTPTDFSGRRLPVEVLGIADQECYVRKPAPTHPETDTQKRNRADRETLLWPRATERIGTAPKAENVRWVRVCDRGADMETFMRGILAAGQGFVVRAAYNRRLMNPFARKRECTGHVFDAARAASPIGNYTIQVRGREGQKARLAEVQVSVVQAHLWRTPQPGAQGVRQLPGIKVSIVRVWETDPLAGVEEPLEWVLLTDANVESFEQAYEVALQYQARWLVEEFHKGLKTGLGADKLQLETGHRLFAAIGLMSVVATRMLALREDMRDRPDDPAETSGFSTTELDVLTQISKKPLNTVKDVVLAVARLGGHMNRKRDGLPGWQTIWAGLSLLDAYVVGFKLARDQFG